MAGRSMTRLLVIVVVTVAIGAAGLGLAYRFGVQEQWRGPAREHERTTAAYAEAFCQAQNLLAQEPFFQRPVLPAPRDGSKVLGAVLGWNGASPDGGARPPTPAQSIPKATREHIRGEFMRELTAEDLAAVDTSFFSGLHDFDRWELTGEGSPLSGVSGTASWTAATSPLPDYVGLMDLSKVHLKRGANEGKLVEAARDVRHAAWLSYSSETMLGAMLGLAMLGIERRAWDWAQAEQVPTGGWTPVREETIALARKVVRAAPAFYSPMASEETFARVMKCDRVTQCSALTEASVLAGGLGSMLDEPWRSRAAAVRMATSAPKGGCSFALARYWYAHPLVIDMPAGAGSSESSVFKGDIGGVLMGINADTGAIEAAFALPDAGR